MSEVPEGHDLDRHRYGAPDAPFTVVEYGDFECPYCGAAAPVLKELVDTSDGQISLVFRHFPLFEVHPYALTAALATEAAGARFFDLGWELFRHQNRLGDADLQAYADALGIGPVTGAAVQPLQAAVAADYAAGVAWGVQGTPTLCVGDEAYGGRVEVRALRAALGVR